MGDVLASLIGSTSVAFAIAVVVVWSFMNMVGSFMRDFVGRALVSAPVSPYPVVPSITNQLIFNDFVPTVGAFLVMALLAGVYVRLRLRPPSWLPLRACPECLSPIPRDARRCSRCTASV